MTRRFPCLCALIQRLKDSPTPYKCPWCGRVHGASPSTKNNPHQTRNRA